MQQAEAFDILDAPAGDFGQRGQFIELAHVQRDPFLFSGFGDGLLKEAAQEDDLAYFFSTSSLIAPVTVWSTATLSL